MNRDREDNRIPIRPPSGFVFDSGDTSVVIFPPSNNNTNPDEAALNILEAIFSFFVNTLPGDNGDVFVPGNMIDPVTREIAGEYKESIEPPMEDKKTQ